MFARAGGLIGGLIAALSLVATPAAARPDTTEPPLVRKIDRVMAAGARFVLTHQAQDGGFPSKTYGHFSEGRALAPLALSALYFSPADPAIQPAFVRGAAFLAKLGSDAALLRPEEALLPYPIYTLAGAVFVLSMPPAAAHEKAKTALMQALLARQLTEAQGWSPADPSYGGFGDFSGVPTKPARPGDDMREANLSATLFAVGALNIGGLPATHAVFRRARGFVERCQNFGEGGDGGFFFGPMVPHRNKAGRVAGEDSRFRSYGTMTADGLRALGVVGSSPERIAAATRWLGKHFRADRAAGDYVEARQVQQASAYYYWMWTAAHALRRTGLRATLDWPEALASALLAKQRPDGSWANAATDLREDDPLVATPFAMAALGIARMQLTGRWRTAF